MGHHNNRIITQLKKWRKLRIPNIAGTKPHNYNISAIQNSIFEIVNKQKPRG